MNFGNHFNISIKYCLFEGVTQLRLIMLLGPLCYKLITIVNYYVETGLSCFVN